MAALLAALAAALLPVLNPAAAYADTRPPIRVAVAPFLDLRHSQSGAWLARFLAVGIADSLLRAGPYAVMPVETAGLWLQRVDAGGEGTIPPAPLQRMGVDFLVRGTVQRVLRSGQIRLRLSAADPAYFAEEVAWELEIDLARDTPGEVLALALRHLTPAMERNPEIRTEGGIRGGETGGDPLPQPAGWPLVERFHTLAAAPPARPGERAKRVAEFAAFQNEPELRAPALGMAAGLLLEQALLETTRAGERRPVLTAALTAAQGAVKAAPWHTGHLALRAQIQYLLKHDYLAKTDASVARLKNPLEGLAYVVLGMVAGLSTVRGDEWMLAGLVVDPFMQGKARTAGAALYRGGALESYFETWERLRVGRGDWSTPGFEEQLKLGLALFEQQNWDEADQAFADAATLDDTDYRPLLYRARIDAETGDPDAAAEQLNVLSGEFPLEWEIWHYLGAALAASGQHAQAEEALRKALAENPGGAQSLYELGSSQMYREDWSAARLTWRRYLEGSTEDGRAWTLLAICETHLQSWPAAIESFREALRIDPEQETARAGLAHAVAQQGE